MRAAREGAVVSHDAHRRLAAGPLVSRPMEIDIRPEPTAEERAALLAAIGADGDPRAEPYRSVWRLAGLLENAESAAEPPLPGAPPGVPRRSRGASLK